MTTKKKRAVILCTDKRGVFFGYTDKPFNRKQMTLTNARMVVYWSEAMHGLPGLAANGPSKKCKISPAMPEIKLVDLHAEITTTKKGADKFESEPWG